MDRTSLVLGNLTAAAIVITVFALFGLWGLIALFMAVVAFHLSGY